MAGTWWKHLRSFRRAEISHLRVGIGRFWHESNGFSPTPTTTRDFSSRGELSVGKEVLDRPGHRDELSGFMDVFTGQDGIEIVPVLSAGALPSGLLTEEAVCDLEEILRRQIRSAGPLDGICFALHGAMSAESIPDLDGHFVAVLREEVGPDVPIICTLDSHAMVTARMVEMTAALVAYRTHPHIDLHETGMRAANILLDVLHGKVRPVTGYRKIPMLLPPSDDGTNTGPLKDLFDTFIAWDGIEDVIACSLCCSFAWQDVPEQGWTALAVTNDNKGLADRLSRELAEKTWAAREQLLPEPMLRPEEAVIEAARTPGRPVIVTDSADTVGGGAPGDNTTLLATLLKMRGHVDGLILAHLPDPEAAAQLKGSKPGETVTVEVGGKRDTRFCEPLSVTGQVSCIAEGPITDDGNFTSEPMVDTGTLIRLDIDNIRLVLSERRIMGPQPSLFRKVGIEPFEAKVVALKTGVGYRTTYGHAAKAVIRADCLGAESYNFENYEFVRIPRPMFPIDGDFDWSPNVGAQGGRGKEEKPWSLPRDDGSEETGSSRRAMR